MQAIATDPTILDDPLPLPVSTANIRASQPSPDASRSSAPPPTTSIIVVLVMTTSATESIDDWGTTLSDLPHMHDHDDQLPDFDIDLFCAGATRGGCGGDGDGGGGSGVDALGLPFSSLDTEMSTTWDVSFMEEPVTTLSPQQQQSSASSWRKSKRSSTIGKRSTRDHPSHGTPTPMKRPKSINLFHRPSPFELYDNDNNTSDVSLFDEDEANHMQVAVHDGSPVNSTDAFDALSHVHTAPESGDGPLPNHVSDALHLRIQRASDPSLSTRSFVSGSLLCRVATNQQALPPIAGALTAVRRAAAMYVSELRGDSTTAPRATPATHPPPPPPRAPKLRQTNVKGRTRKPVANRRVRRKENLTSFTAVLPPLALERMPPAPPGALTPLQRYMQSAMA